MAYRYDPYETNFSLADTKSLKVSQKLAEKQQRLTPEPQVQRDARDLLFNRDPVGSSSLADFAGSSLRQAGGNLADVLRTGSNKVFGTEFEDTGRAQGWSNPEIADALAGVSPEARAQATAEDQRAMQDIAEGNYWDAFTNVASNAPRHLAEQAGMLAELAGGAVATGGIGTVAKLGQLAYRGKEAYTAAKAAAAAAPKWQKALKAVGKNQATVAPLNADILQGIREDYKAQHNGEEPSMERMMGAGVLVAATTSFQPAIVTKLWLPQGKSLAAGNLRTKLKAEAKAMMKYADSSLAQNVARTVASGVTKVGKAGGAEAVQEYFQTWAEILSTNMEPEEAGGLLKAAFNEIASEENRNEATYGAFVGGVVGGAARATTAVPTAAAGVTADAAMATGKAMAKQAKKANAVLKFGELSEQDKADLYNEYQGQKAAHEEKIKILDQDTFVLESVDTFDDVKDPALRQRMINKAEGADLNDSRNFHDVRKALIRENKSAADISRAKVEGHYVYSVGEAKFKKAWEQSKEFVEKHVPVEKIKEYANKVADTAIGIGETVADEIRNLDTSETVGLAEAAVAWHNEKTKDLWAAVNEKASQMTPEAIRKVARTFPEGNPVRQRLMTKADKREQAHVTSGIKKEKLVTWKDVSDPIKRVAAQGLRDESPGSLATILRSELKGRPDDKQSIQAYQKALDEYEKTDHYKNQDAGALSPREMKSFRKKLDKRAEAYATPARDAVEGILTNITTQLADAIITGAEKVVNWDFTTETADGYAVPTSEAGTKFLKSLEKLAMKVKDMDPEEQQEMVAGIIKDLSSAGRMDSYKNMFKTDDPQVVAELIDKAMPNIDTEALIKEMVKTKPDTKADQTKPVDLNKVKVTDKPVTGSGKIRITEDGEYVVEKTITSERYKELLSEVLSGTVICNG